MANCGAPDCERGSRTRGLCNLHYLRWRQTGRYDLANPSRARPRPVSVCAVAGCEGEHVAKGWCALHYHRMARRGSVDLPPVPALPPLVTSADILAYAAGLIDGEGSISIRARPSRRSLYVVISIANTDQRMTDWLRTQFGGTVGRSHQNPERGWRPQWTWQLLGGAVCQLLEAVQPWLIVKGEQARVALGFEQLRTPGRVRLSAANVAARHALKAEMGELNRRRLQ